MDDGGRETGPEGRERSKRPPRLRDQVLWFALAVLAVASTGLLAGMVFGRTAPERAAGTLLSDVVVREEHRGDARVPSTTDEAAPTSGDHVGDARCGVLDGPVGADTQLASLAAGIVVVQYVPGDLDVEDVARLGRWVTGDRQDRVLLAPNPRLDAPVMATAWTRRLPLHDVELALLGTFVTAYAGGGPRPAACDPSGRG